VSTATQARPGAESTTSQASPLQQLTGYIKTKPMVPLLIATAATIALLLVLLLWAGAPEYRVIYSNLSESDGGRIISELERRQIPFKLGQGGTTILVPGDEVHALRLKLAEQGLPQGGGVGFELMDNQSFGISQFAEQINFQRGLEGELSRSIESLGPVVTARVHLVMAKQSVFARDRQPGSASVVLTLQPGREMGPGQIQAIAHMVASSVQNLPAEAVTVVDQMGRLLSKPAAGDGLDNTQLTYTQEIERAYQLRIETILAPILGARNVKAQVVAQVDYSKREATEERYGPNRPPNEAAVRSEQKSEQYNGENAERGVPGALTNSPPNAPAITGPEGGEPAANAPDAQTTAQKGSISRDEMVNYEVDRTVEHIQHRRGQVTRLSAAVVVNYRDKVDEEGNVTQEPLSEAELASITRLVRQAMGFSEKRGDEMELINSPFSQPEALPEVPWWKTPEFFNLATSIGKYLIIAIIALLIWLMVFRPMMRRQREANEAAIAAANPVRAALASELGDEDIPSDEDEVVLPARRKRQVYAHNMKGFVEMAKEDPRLVATVFRNWMKENEN